ncbi:Ubiquinone biosynthesis hydroxylase UbiH/UbiF/VisC/COQ6 family [Methyloversatilis universalis FAM5]|uniref:Ubiquinone biosynthesis hydroxylase UbiH/UbiF/VisC/COQ6 family n=1 Tax=Methyloversatilis universalis (strain ATCC BAA-1314 / DSM 25237 / JCM 13912 / CCUG 52030 / FAM5) TaxID=1000565 RepID=F5RH74_METUF|nr:UbiH/UbiF family hydroxylase [Methyloversatilis universalis]EGK70278.1 Ubiquinone biosynthesis hydroxylase UbiH/UbiF/VisC/COQ6 family [Methyloversatilis universalis FAM5]
MQRDLEFDVVVVGAGLAGLALCAALRRTQLSVALVEGRPPEWPVGGWDARVYAVSPSSARFLDQIGAWAHLDSTRLQPMARIEVFGDRGAQLDFSAFDVGVGELAWIAESSLIARELWEGVKRQANVTLLCPAKPAALAVEGGRARLALEDGRTLDAALVVGADGVQSWVRAQAGLEARFTDYAELGVVANFRCERPHLGTAWQWFRPDGVLAYLPLPDGHMSMVWSAPEAVGRELLQYDAETLAAHVAAAGDHMLGRLEVVTPAAGFPLRLMQVPRVVASGVALIGDAAHAIHPLSGHGVNLGFADARELSALLAGLDRGVLGDLRALRRYERRRAEEVNALQLTTHALHELFRPQWPALSWLRNTGLKLTARVPVVRNALVRYALG